MRYMISCIHVHGIIDGWNIMTKTRIYGLTRQERAILGKRDPERYGGSGFKRFRYYYLRPIISSECPKGIKSAPRQGDCMRCEMAQQEIKTLADGKLWYGDFKCTRLRTVAHGMKKVEINPEDVSKYRAMGKDVKSEEVYD